jgi:hypothetical protein
VLFEKPKQQLKLGLQMELKKQVEALGDPQLLNDAIFENYNSCTHYFDDDLLKTAGLLDSLS